MSAADPREVLDRPAPGPDQTVRYGPASEHVADLWWPACDKPPPADGAPLVVVVHGGFWRAEFDRRHTRPQCTGLVAAGYTVAAIEYRRTGQQGGGWPGTFEDVDAALSAVPGLVAAAATAVGQPVDVRRTVLLGHSAGGHLVAWAAAARRLPGVLGAVSLAGVLDLALAASLGLDPGASGSAVQELLGGLPDDVPDRYALADPTRLDPPAVPVTALHGDADDVVPVELSRSYARATGQQLVVLEDVDHFSVIDPMSVAWSSVLKHVGAAAGRTPG